MSIIDLIRSLNILRRHLTPSQRAMVAARLLEPYKAEAKVRQIASGGDRKSEDYEKSVVANLPQPIDREPLAADVAASDFGVSGRLVRDAEVVIKQGNEEEIRAVERGEMKVTPVANGIRERKKADLSQGGLTVKSFNHRPRKTRCHNEKSSMTTS